MNLSHMKYAVEIAKTNSMTKTAEELFTSQPNLSRAIRELESTLGIEIFKRTSKGIYPTAQGEEFLGYARKILAEVDAVEEMYRDGKKNEQKFSISVPRACYISCAFTEFINKIDQNEKTEIFYKETNSMRAINNIVNAGYKLGILRYQSAYEQNFCGMLKDKGLESELICEFNYVLVMSSKHPLANRKSIEIDDLTPFIEIAHADPFVPSMPLSTVRKNEIIDNVDKHIYVFERGSQMDILCDCVNAFMWVSPVPEKLLDRFSLVERECAGNTKKYRDVLIYKKDYILNKLDKMFIGELDRFKKNIE